MNKVKIAIAGIITVGAGLAFASFVGAANPVAVSCSGSVATNVVTWTAVPTGGNSPYALLWSGTNVGGTSSVVTATYNATGTFTANVQVTDASSTVATSSCTAVVASLPVVTPPPAPTSTPTLPPRVNAPLLHIEGNGHFLARGMTVTGVASGTIQAQVWGITYTINLATGGSEFLRRDGKNLSFTLSQQVAVGDEVSVSGTLSPASPFVVNAGVVRDASIVVPRQKHEEDNQGGEDHHGDMMMSASSTGSSSMSDSQGRLNDLLKQLKDLQDRFNSQSGKDNGGGHQGGNGGGY